YILVLDEADLMCDMGFLPDIRRILAKLPRERQTLFFSATMPNEIRTLSNDLLRNPATVQIDVATPAKTVQHALFPVHESLKARLLSAMIKSMPDGRVLVFTRTKHRAKRLAQNLVKEGGRVAMLQGNMSQNKRQEAMKGFQSGKYDVLVATDIAARGIDVADISHVINFDMPDTADTYIHRIGRTGRALQTGDAFTFSTPSDEDTIRGIEKILKSKIERKQFPDFDYSVSAEAMQARPPQPHRGGHGGGHSGRPARRPHHQRASR
ncbi:MAG: DEAD/DEAH box helicase, partial [Spirochaetia bacterium]|nr:DEAD/DEAH box helicase [Spirochaetia bacterium]